MPEINENIGRQIVQSGAAVTLARIISRVFTLIRAITIARWLGPKEMGVFAVTMVVIGALEQLSETGLRPALVQRQGDINKYRLPVRTVNAVRGIFIGLLIFISAPLIAKLFHSPESLSILKIIAILPVITGFEPLYIILSQKELQFARVVKLQLLGSFISLGVGVAYAYFKPDAWALLWSSLADALIVTVGAHVLSAGSDIRFSFKWGCLRDLRHFGTWTMINRQVAFIYRRGSDWIVGLLLNVKDLAFYQMAFLFSSTLIMEFGNVIGQLSFPIFSKFQDDRERLLRAFHTSFGIISILVFFMAALIVGCAGDLFHVLLGDKWLPALPLVPWLIISVLSDFFNRPQGSILQALGRVDLATKMIIWRSLAWLVFIYPMVHYWGILGSAMTLAFFGVFFQLYYNMIISRVLKLSYFRISKHLVIPGMAFALAAIGGLKVKDLLYPGNNVIGLFLSAMVVSALYIIIIYLGKQWLEPSPQELLQRLKSLFAKCKS